MVPNCIKRSVEYLACVANAEKPLHVYFGLANACIFRNDVAIIDQRPLVLMQATHYEQCLVANHTDVFANSVIYWPNEQERNEISEEFGKMGFPGGVVGCMDDSHIRIDRPSYGSVLVDYMDYIAISITKIEQRYTRYPGSVHDSRIYRNSPLFKTHTQKCKDGFIIADSAYPCLRNVMTRLRDTGNLTPDRAYIWYTLWYVLLNTHTFVLYIYIHLVCIIKQKFRQLYHLKLRNLTTMCHFIRARIQDTCCVLYNLSLNEEFDAEANDFIKWK
ncbi:hypothetical protein NQ315_015226 [Exocentrus adspersus]|uniref:DDE Tnp4 domain-containing protein n=1 Tax=Exocentrus adspersus TaxID=1586481 RepID=A0AAV8VWA0_9CUCU|nr:hypothetical protein NQ315_015226 [Exocentrus adspersus]